MRKEKFSNRMENICVGDPLFWILGVSDQGDKGNRVSCERVGNKRFTDTYFGGNEIEGAEDGS